MDFCNKHTWLEKFFNSVATNGFYLLSLLKEKAPKAVYMLKNYMYKKIFSWV